MLGLATCAGTASALADLISRITSQSPPPRPVRVVALFILAILLLMGYVLFTSEPSTVGYGPDLAYPSVEEREQLRKIALNMRQTAGNPFFSDDPGMVALAGKQTLYDDPFTMTALAPSGRWDEAVYRNMLREGAFPLLVLSCDVSATLSQNESGDPAQTAGRPCRHDTFTPGVLEAIRDGYTLAFRDVFFTYAPK
jgi:hypothetical protein